MDFELWVLLIMIKIYLIVSAIVLYYDDRD